MAAIGDGCPKWGDLTFENGKESYGNIPMSVSKSGPPGVSGVATMPLGLTERPITITGIMVGGTGEPAVALKTKQKSHEAACQTLTLKKFTTGNGRVFPKVRYVSIVWSEPFGNAVTGKCDVRYTATLMQTVPEAEE